MTSLCLSLFTSEIYGGVTRSCRGQEKGTQEQGIGQTALPLSALPWAQRATVGRMREDMCM